jgi:hypothetical protein
MTQKAARLAEQARVAKVWKAANEKPYVGNPDEIACSSAAQVPAGYSSFSAAKRALGSPGDGNVFDHIVEQSQIGRSNLAAEEIHNPFNMNPVTAQTNQLKANYYSTKTAFSRPGTVRDWLTGQSYGAQREFGLDITNRIEQGRPLR